MYSILMYSHHPPKLILQRGGNGQIDDGNVTRQEGGVSPREMHRALAPLRSASKRRGQEVLLSGAQIILTVISELQFQKDNISLIIRPTKPRMMAH